MVFQILRIEVLDMVVLIGILIIIMGVEVIMSFTLTKDVKLVSIVRIKICIIRQGKEVLGVREVQPVETKNTL